MRGRHEDWAHGGDWGGAWYDRAVSGIIVGSIDMRSLFENDIQANGGGNASGRGRGRFRWNEANEKYDPSRFFDRI